MMIPAIANKFALLWGFCDIWPGGHLYGSRLGNCKQVCIALGFCDIWPDGHLYGSRLGNCKQVCIALGFCVYLRFCYEIKYNVKLINRQ